MSARGVTDEVLSAYLDDEVTAGERQSVEDALASSVDVQERLARLRETRDAVRHLDDPGLPEGFLVELEHAVTADAPASVAALTSPAPRGGRTVASCGWPAGSPRLRSWLRS